MEIFSSEFCRPVSLHHCRWSCIPDKVDFCFSNIGVDSRSCCGSSCSSSRGCCCNCCRNSSTLWKTNNNTMGVTGATSAVTDAACWCLWRWGRGQQLSHSLYTPISHADWPGRRPQPIGARPGARLAAPPPPPWRVRPRLLLAPLSRQCVVDRPWCRHVTVQWCGTGHSASP